MSSGVVLGWSLVLCSRLTVVQEGLPADWTGYELKRVLTEPEQEDLRQRLIGWISRPDVPTLDAFARKCKIADASDQPIYQVAIETLEEERTLVAAKRPYEGQALCERKVKDVNVWGSPTPAYTGFSAKAWRLPVEGSLEVKLCTGCSGRGSTDCQGCGGDGLVDCSTCHAEGNISCARCNGVGWLICRHCDTTEKPDKDEKCTYCGRARTGCKTCDKRGKVQCPTCFRKCYFGCQTCRTKGKLPCGPCNQQGKLVEVLEIQVAIVVRSAEQLFTTLEDPWRSPGKGNDGTFVWQTRENLEEAVQQIADEKLRTILLMAASKEREGKQRLRGQRVGLHRVPVTFATFEIEGNTYHVAVRGNEFTSDHSPHAQWLAIETQVAKAKLEEGNFVEARSAAEQVLKVNAGSAAAAEVLKEMERIEEEKKVAALAATSTSSTANGVESVPMSDRTCILIFGGFVVAVILSTAIAVKLSLTHHT